MCFDAAACGDLVTSTGFMLRCHALRVKVNVPSFYFFWKFKAFKDKLFWYVMKHFTMLEAAGCNCVRVCARALEVTNKEPSISDILHKRHQLKA